MARIIDKGNGSYLIRVSLGRVNGKQSISSTTFRPNPRTESGRMKAASVIAGEVERFAYEYEKQNGQNQDIVLLICHTHLAKKISLGE